MTANGVLVDDFAFDSGSGIVHVRNAPSPAATSSLGNRRHRRRSRLPLRSRYEDHGRVIARRTSKSRV